MVDEGLVRKQLIELVSDFRANQAQHKKELESNTETKLIEPLFKILGWTSKDFEKTAHARRAGKAGFPDYAFKLNGRTVFFVEVKKVGVDLEKEANKQVISYALSVGGVPFAISTNFEELRIFCVEEDNAVNNVFRVFTKPEHYIERFHDLLYLHKENFEQNKLLKLAEEEGRLKKRVSIDKPLLEDLMSIRNMIANDVEKRYPGKYQLNEREEIIQRIVDRLIFIRKCEDAGINPENQTLKETRNNVQNRVYPKLKALFKEYDNIYNGGLFAIGKDNDCDKIEIEGEIVQKLIDLLYRSKDGQYFYDFEVIGADILGQVYEQYLGKILAYTASGKSKLTDGQAHRKEQGIYYTPTFIVDYIVSNTLGILLKEKKADAKKIKVLDPACGSGSFLIKAFDYLKENLYSENEAKLHRLDEQGIYSIKTAILKNNIYGVDLDAKAVEITKLNLLLKAAEKYRKLPEDVDLHIRQGNSLINDESVAGLNAFRWEGDFQEGSFDIVIGNPPYIRVQTSEEGDKDYLIKNYVSAQGKFDLYIVFIEKALRLLAEDGYFSFVVPNKFAQTKYGKGLKEFILENFTISRFIDFGDLKVFGEVTTYPCILVIKKKKPSNRAVGKYVKVKKLAFDIEQRIIAHQDTDGYEDEFLKVFNFKQKNLDTELWSFMPSIVQDIFDKIRKSSEVRLIDLRERIYEGFICGNNSVFFLSGKEIESLKIESELVKPVPKGKNVRRYSIKWGDEYVLFPHIQGKKRTESIVLSDHPFAQKYLEKHKDDLLKRKYVIEAGKEWFEIWNTRNINWFEQDKIITPNLSPRNNFSIDFKENKTGKYFYVDHDCYGIILKNKNRENYLYLLGLLNSKMMDFYIKQKSPMFSGGYYKYHTQYLEQIPIIEPKPEIKNKLIELIKRMLSFNEHLLDIGDKKTNESVKINEELEKTDAEIDRIVYEMYGLTKEEIQIIEEAVSSASD